MDEMINSELIKKLRKQRSWSQDQMASISGLSHRTIQRIENEGRCSLESKKALAAAFEINANELNINTVAVIAANANRRGAKFGFWGAGVGLVSAYTGISISLTQGHISSGEAGLYFGIVGTFFGVCCAIIGVLSRKLKSPV